MNQGRGLQTKLLPQPCALRATAPPVVIGDSAMTVAIVRAGKVENHTQKWRVTNRKQAA